MATKKMKARGAGKAMARKMSGAKKAAKKVARRIAKKVSPIPKGFHSVTPHLNVRGAEKAIQFYRSAFGAKELNRMPGPDGRIMHAEIRIGDSIVMLADEMPEMGSRAPQTVGGVAGNVMIYVKDVDALFQRAISAGATVVMPLQDMFWGDRYGKVVDPFGHEWQLAEHKEDLSPKEMAKRAQAAFSGPPPGGPGGPGGPPASDFGGGI